MLRVGIVLLLLGSASGLLALSALPRRLGFRFLSHLHMHEGSRGIAWLDARESSKTCHERFAGHRPPYLLTGLPHPICVAG